MNRSFHCCTCALCSVHGTFGILEMLFLSNIKQTSSVCGTTNLCVWCELSTDESILLLLIQRCWAVYVSSCMNPKTQINAFVSHMHELAPIQCDSQPTSSSDFRSSSWVSVCVCVHMSERTVYITLNKFRINAKYSIKQSVI